MPTMLELGNVINTLIKSMLADTHTATIGRVVAVHEKTIDVQPVMNRLVKGKSVRLPVFAQVPPTFLQGGGSYHAFPIAKGDYCLLIISERCFDGWYNGQDEVSPLEYRIHDYSDTIAIVGLNNKQGAIEIPDVIQETGDTNQDGNWTHQGNRTQTGDYTLTGNIVHTGNVTQTGNVDLTGDYTQVGDMDVDGALDVTGNVSCGSLTINGKPYGDHAHSGVETGAGNSGGVVNP